MSVKFYVVNDLNMEHNPTDEVLRESDIDVTVCLNPQYSPQRRVVFSVESTAHR